MTKLFCINCGDECNQVEETFDCAGTHCNHGQSGTHHTGNYVSDCCFDETTDEKPLAQNEKLDEQED